MFGRRRFGSLVVSLVAFASACGEGGGSGPDATPIDAVRIARGLRHSEPGAPPPELHLRMVDSALWVQVRDYGTGVPEDHLPHLAQAFYRPDTARQRTTGGVGLGLYLCRLVAQAHGGSLEIANARPGLLVTARFRLAS